MLRKTLTTLSLIGLLLSVAAWGLSYFRARCIPPGGTPFASLSRGQIALHFAKEGVPWERSEDVETLLLINDTTSVVQYTVKYKPGVQFSGFMDWTTRWRPGMSQGNAFWGRGILVPLWIPIVLFAVMFWWSFLPLHRRRKRKKLGLCLKCGYDLRGSTNRCPECGTEFEKTCSARP